MWSFKPCFKAVCAPPINASFQRDRGHRNGSLKTHARGVTCKESDDRNKKKPRRSRVRHLVGSRRPLSWIWGEIVVHVDAGFVYESPVSVFPRVTATFPNAIRGLFSRLE